jgi:putative membrane protein
MSKANEEQRSVLKGLASGVIGGLAAAYVMNQFQVLLKKFESDHKQSKPDGPQSSEATEKKEPATVKAAEALSETVLNQSWTKSEKEVAGPAVHYAMGATSGAIYGVAAEMDRHVTLGAGLPFGAAVWLIADELAVPAAGLAKLPSEYPAKKHVEALAAHLVYGATTDAVRRVVRRAL